MLAQHLFAHLNADLVIAQTAQAHAGNAVQSTRLIAHAFAEFVQIVLAHVAVENQRDHLVQAFIELHLGRLDAFRQSAHGLHAALHVIQHIPRIMTAFHLHLDGAAAFAGGALYLLNAGQIGYGILERDHDGFLHLLRRGAAVGNADLNFVRREIGEHLHRQPVDDAIDPHEDDEHHHEVSRHAIAGKPGDHRVHPEVALVFFGAFPLPLVLPLPLP